MSPRETTSVLRDLDSARSVLDVLATLLENNAAVSDYHSLSVLAADGRGKIDIVIDVLAG